MTAATARVLYKSQGATLTKFSASTANVQILRGPLGAGKTIACCHKLFSLICNEFPDKHGVRESEWLVTRSTLPQLKSTTIRDWLSVVPKSVGGFSFGPPPKHVLDFDLTDGTRVQSVVWFIALDSEKAVDKIRGSTLTGAWMNEAKLQPRSVFRDLHSRTGRFREFGKARGGVRWSGVFADTNAWDKDHWLQERADLHALGQLPTWEFFVQPPGVIKVDGQWVVNPECEGVPGIRDSYYQNKMIGEREDWIKVNLGNQIGLSIDGKPVHPDFSESMHVARENLEPIPGVIYVGLDFGLTPAAVFWQRQANGQWYGLEELVIEDGDARVLANEIKARCAAMQSRTNGGLTFVFRGDPSGDIRSQTNSETAFQVMRANGVSALPCTSNDPTIRRGALDRPLTRTVRGQPGLLVSPKMRKLIRALSGGYHYARIKILTDDPTYRDVPVKDMNSHVAEAAEYGLMDAGEHEIVNANTVAPIVRPTGPIRPQGQNWSVFDV